jgi:hypothetical protein
MFSSWQSVSSLLPSIYFPSRKDQWESYLLCFLKFKLKCIKVMRFVFFGCLGLCHNQYQSCFRRVILRASCNKLFLWPMSPKITNMIGDRDKKKIKYKTIMNFQDSNCRLQVLSSYGTTEKQQEWLLEFPSEEQKATDFIPLVPIPLGWRSSHWLHLPPCFLCTPQPLLALSERLAVAPEKV